MRKIINYKIFLIIIFPLIIAGWYLQNKKDQSYNDYKCETQKYVLNGVIDNINSKSGYMQIHIRGIDKWISLNIHETIQNHGLPDNYFYQIGDSIIKEANSKKFMIKRGVSFAVYLLDCND